MTRLDVARVLSAVALAAAGCGEPTLEEACESYCDAAQSADCGDLPAECAAGCGGLEDVLTNAGWGDCLDQYALLLDCAAGGSFECVSGATVPSAEGCTEEALDFAECIDQNQSPPPPG